MEIGACRIYMLNLKFLLGSMQPKGGPKTDKKLITSMLASKYE